MPLIHGTTDITSVVYNGTNLTEVIYNGTSVWTAGFSLGLFMTQYNNSQRVTRIDTNGAIYGTETTVGSALNIVYTQSGASVGGIAIFCGGTKMVYGNSINICKRVNNLGQLYGSETYPLSIDKYSVYGAGLSNYGMFIKGYTYNASTETGVYSETKNKIDVNGLSVATSSNVVGSSRNGGGFASTKNMCITYGGAYWNALANNGVYNTCTRMDINFALVGSDTTLGSARAELAGAIVDNNFCCFYGGSYRSNNTTTTAVRNYANKINESGALAVSEVSLGTARSAHGGASVQQNAMFYGGNTGTSSYVASNKCTRISKDLALVGSETSVGAAYQWLYAGAGV